jgi:hypothetical protein
MRPRGHKADEQARLDGYRQTIERYLRYVLIRCAGYTNDKAQVQRIAAYTLVTACLLFDKLRGQAEPGPLVEMMVRIVGEDPMGDWRLDADEGGEEITRRVFVLNGRMCEVAGTINAVEPLARQLLILHHIEGLDAEALAEAYGLSADEVRTALGQGEREFLEILHGLSPGDDGTEPDVRGLLVRLARCIDLPWAQALGAFALGYAAQWSEQRTA